MFLLGFFLSDLLSKIKICTNQTAKRLLDGCVGFNNPETSIFLKDQFDCQVAKNLERVVGQ